MIDYGPLALCWKAPSTQDGQGSSAGDRRLKCRATCETDGREIGIDALVMRN